ncbi:glycosyltransferase [Clostridium paraputrificum]|uniref:glycosyltransferase n=1 Tax=Clostridium paraputrificum TaxID=29363 RepID=UPI003D33CC41
MKRILVATHVKFWHKSEGGEQRIQNIMELFNENGNEMVLLFVGSLGRTERRDLLINFPKVKIYTTENGQKDKIKSILKKFKIFKKINTKIKNTKDYTLDDYYSMKDSRIFNEVVLKEKPDVIWIEMIRLAYLISDNKNIIDGNMHTVVDTLDVMHERCKLFSINNQKSWVNISEEEERKVLDIFDTVVAIQDTDKKKFEKMLNKNNVITVLHKPKVEKLPFRVSDRINITYIAAGNISNVDSIKGFINSVWNKLYLKFGDKIRLNIYGKVSEYLDDVNEAGVSIKGFAENLRDVYCESDIIINPVLFGSGLKIKNVEAICYGKPLVTTSIGAEGIETGVNKGFILADDIDDQYIYMERLIIDDKFREKISNEAYLYSLNKFNTKNIYSELREIL